MATPSVKGFLKGLRYISHVFDEKEEEKIQIGFPTDVKHLSHIGWDDQSANAPSWMNEFRSAPELKAMPQPSSGALNSTETPEVNNDNNRKGGEARSGIPKSRHHSIDSEGGDKQTRRHRSSDPSSDYGTGTRHARRNRNGNESPSHEKLPPTTANATGTATATKQSRRKKSKTTSGDGSEKKTSRTRRSSKGDSLTDISLSDVGPASENGHGSK